MNSERSILIVEPSHGGHRANHVGIIVRYLRTKGLEPKLLTSEKSATAGGFDDLGIQISCFDSRPIKLPFYASSAPRSLHSQIRIFHQIASYLEAHQAQIQCAIFPTLQASGLLPAGMSKSGFCVPWVGIVMAPGGHLREHAIKTHHSPMELWVQRRAYRRLVKQPNCRRIGSFDPLFADWMNEPNVVYCPDPVSISQDEDTDPLVTATDKPVILVAGSIDKRKKVCELADVLATVNRTDPLHLVIAGKPNDEIRHQLENSSALKELQKTKSLDLILRRLSDPEIDYLFQRADIVWSGNLRAYGSSGAVVRAGMHGKPVVTMQNSVLGNWMQQTGGGPVADLTSPKALKKLFQKLVSDKTFRETTGRNNYALFADNTEQKYCKVLLGPLELSNAASPKGNCCD